MNLFREANESHQSLYPQYLLAVFAMPGTQSMFAEERNQWPFFFININNSATQLIEGDIGSYNIRVNRKYRHIKLFYSLFIDVLASENQRCKQICIKGEQLGIPGEILANR